MSGAVGRWLRRHRWALVGLAVTLPVIGLVWSLTDWREYSRNHPLDPVEAEVGETVEYGDHAFTVEDVTITPADEHSAVVDGATLVTVTFRIDLPTARDEGSCTAQLAVDGRRFSTTENADLATTGSGVGSNCYWAPDMAFDDEPTGTPRFRSAFEVPAAMLKEGTAVLELSLRDELPRYVAVPLD